MAGTLVASNINDGTSTGNTTDMIKGSARAWVNFNGIPTPAIRAAYNVSSITDNGEGNYTVNFTTPMPDANYCAVSSGATATSFTTNPGPVESTVGVYSLLTTSCSIAAVRPGDFGELAQPTYVVNGFVAIFR